MYSRRLKTGYFILEGLNSFATVYFFYYFYFFMGTVYGFDNRLNLCLAALNGGTYAIFAWLGGKFARRFGAFTALKLGFTLMPAALAVGLQLHWAGGQVAVMVLTVVGMCFTWPTLEGLVGEGETRAGLQEMVGMYNVVWSSSGAVAYFSGGAIFEKLGPHSLFYVPIAIQLSQLGLTFWLESQARRNVRLGVQAQAGQTLAAEQAAAAPPPDGEGYRGGVSAEESARILARSVLTPEAHPHPRAKAESFLWMAWLANPFGYVAINTLVAVIPGVARRLGLSPMLAGFCCSVWCFARLGAFFGLWFWDGWHYRFRWLLAAFVTLVGTFAAILLVPNLAVLVLAQLFLGGALGLIYYSSLFYSMDLGEDKSEHGGFHEAAIGLGNFAGPAVGAASLYLAPHYANSGAIAVSGLLTAGLGGLVGIWLRGNGHKARVSG